jgi:hypothetical protein
LGPRSTISGWRGVIRDISHPWPLETILLSIRLEHEKMIGDIQGKLKEREGMSK